MKELIKRAKSIFKDFETNILPFNNGYTTQDGNVVMHIVKKKSASNNFTYLVSGLKEVALSESDEKNILEQFCEFYEN